MTSTDRNDSINWCNTCLLYTSTEVDANVAASRSEAIDASLTEFYEQSKKDDVGHVSQIPTQKPSNSNNNNQTSNSNNNNNTGNNSNNNSNNNTTNNGSQPDVYKRQI